jgi:hypothetical protein
VRLTGFLETTEHSTSSVAFCTPTADKRTREVRKPTEERPQRDVRFVLDVDARDFTLEFNAFPPD